MVLGAFVILGRSYCINRIYIDGSFPSLLYVLPLSPRQNVKAAVTSETQLASSDLATVAECIAYLRDRVPWPVDEIFSFQQKKERKGSVHYPYLYNWLVVWNIFYFSIYWK